MKRGARFARAGIVVAIVATLLAASRGGARAQPAPAPEPAASPTPRALGVTNAIDASLTLVDQATRGPGQVGPEAPAFIAGSASAPDTPYDLFSSAPLVPGVAGIGQLVSTTRYAARTFDLGLVTGIGYARGSVTNAAYWAQSLLPTLNPHLGSPALPYAVAFPEHAGGDDGTAFRASVLGGSLATADGALRLRGGWFDLAQTDRFVFVAPPVTNVDPAIGVATAESLGNGPPSLATWPASPTTLPLHGLDLVGTRGAATLELSTAALPALAGTSARVTLGSFVVDRGEGTRFSGELAHVSTGGDPIVTTVAYGADPRFVPTPTGVLATSTLHGQRQTNAGLRAAFHLWPHSGIAGTIELGRSWYDADAVVAPGSQRPGGFYHVGVARVAGRATASLDLYRMDARYATIILPYGIAENQWSATFAWPGQWLKSNYQTVDNTVLGVNRQGYRLRYFIDKGPLEVHGEYADLRQIEPETTITSQRNGFVDGFYLPQLPAYATFGRQRRYGFWAAWHPRFADVSLDVVDDTLFRPFSARHVEDRVSYEVPQAILGLSRHLSPSVVASASFGRYGLRGSFAEPVDVRERVFLAGVEIAEAGPAALLVNVRRTVFDGRSTVPAAGRGADFAASTIVVEQRLHL